MANILPVFELTVNGQGAVGTETWVHVLTIPSGYKLWIGYATYGAVDKDLQFETRTNTPGTTTGTMANTNILDYCGSAQGNSVDRDFYWGGALATMSDTSTGVEKLWLRVTGNGQVMSGFEYVIRYTFY